MFILVEVKYENYKCNPAFSVVLFITIQNSVICKNMMREGVGERDGNIRKRNVIAFIT